MLHLSGPVGAGTPTGGMLLSDTVADPPCPTYDCKDRLLMMEVALVFDRDGKTIHWHLPPGRDNGSIPDTRSLWEVLWANRAIVCGVAHTHPWDGPAWPSPIDVTTFRAIELGLGRPLLWPVVTFTELRCFEFNEGASQYQKAEPLVLEDVEKLRELSR